MNYSLAQLQALAASVGFPDPSLAAAVAMAESGGNPCAQGDPNIGVHSCIAPNGTSTSFGLWQVNTTYNPQFDAKSLLNPQYNAQAALAISNGGKVWTPWTTYRIGAYRQWYLPMVTPPSEKRRGGALIAVAGAIALATAVGIAVHQARSKPEQPEPEPDIEPEFDDPFQWQTSDRIR